MHDVLLAFGLTLIAGLSTGIGSLIAFLAKRTSRRFLSVSLGFSAGVMIYVSMVELLDTAREGDSIITLEVSRLSRSTQQLCEIINIIRQKRLRLVIVGSITVDCRSGEIDPMSQAFIQMSAVFAELELSMIRARVKSGMANARAKGRRIGRPCSTKEDIPGIFLKHYPAYKMGKMNVSELARVCGLSRPTVYKYLGMV